MSTKYLLVKCIIQRWREIDMQGIQDKNVRYSAKIWT
jgi:hypothetical protein